MESQFVDSTDGLQALGTPVTLQHNLGLFDPMGMGVATIFIARQDEVDGRSIFFIGQVQGIAGQL